MKEEVIFSEDGKSFTVIYSDHEAEFVNPIEYYENWTIQESISFERKWLYLRDPIITQFISDEFYLKRAKEKWMKQKRLIDEAGISENFINLLSSTTKKDQEQLLKGQKISPFQLAQLAFIAWTDYGYSYSSYRADHHHKGVDEENLPSLIHLDGDKVKKVGHTTLTDGQLKNVVNQRKVVISKFLDKGDEWHCFFSTLNALNGRENWREGTPHYHYISDKWGLTRQDALDKLKSPTYPSTQIHIELTDYRK